MEDYPKTLMEFEKRFKTNSDCLNYIISLRWPDGFLCPRCGGNKVWRTAKDLLHCSNCQTQTSVIAGTIFQDTHQPLLLWFRAMWYITNQKNGGSALGLQRILGLGSYRTAWRWLHKLRRAMIRPGRDRISGIVQVDEAFVGGKQPGKRGRGASGKALVLVMVEIDEEKAIGRIRLRRIRDASGLSLRSALLECVVPGSIIQTDAWNGYNQIEEDGFQRQIVQQTSEIDDPILPQTHLIISLLKRWLLGTHQGAVRASHIEYYLDEYTFRFNRRTCKSRGKLFYRLIEQALQTPPVAI